MAAFGIVDGFLVYQFVKRLIKPFKKWKAFQTGVIDETGKILVPQDKRTLDQNASFKSIDLLVLNLKKLLAKVPGGGSTLATYAAAVALLREDNIDSMDETELVECIERHIDEARIYMAEDAPTNAVGSGAAVAGLNDETFAGHRVFHVDSDKAWKSRNGKGKRDRYKKYVGEDDDGNEIRDFARKNPKKSIVLKDKMTGSMMFLRRAKPK